LIAKIGGLMAADFVCAPQVAKAMPNSLRLVTSRLFDAYLADV
jgi:hypothetical protein